MTEAFSSHAVLLYPGQVSLKVPGVFFLLRESPLSISFCLLILAAPTLKFPMFQLFICYCLLQNIPLVSVQLPGQWLTAGLRRSILVYGGPWRSSVFGGCLCWRWHGSQTPAGSDMLIQPAYPLSYWELWGEGLHRSGPVSAWVNSRVDRTLTEYIFLFSILVSKQALIFFLGLWHSSLVFSPQWQTLTLVWLETLNCLSVCESVLWWTGDLSRVNSSHPGRTWILTWQKSERNKRHSYQLQ